MLQLEIEEDADLGEREGAVARRILDENLGEEFPTIDFNPYERRWDGMLPIEDDPLTRLRLLRHESVRFDPARRSNSSAHSVFETRRRLGVEEEASGTATYPVVPDGHASRPADMG